MKTPEELSKDPATAKLMESFSTNRSRRALLKGAAAGAAGLAAVGAGAAFMLPKGSAHAAPSGGGTGAEDSITTIFTIAAIAERLAVTFYANGIMHADRLGIEMPQVGYLKAALVEEQIHELFFVAAGGMPNIDTFSFPAGPKTFTDLATFIATQQQLEGVFDSAFLAAIREFAYLGRPDLAMIAGQIATIEAEHRALGRVIGNLFPPDNWAFSPVLLESVGDAPALVKKAGYLSPVSGNSYTYHQVSTDFPGVVHKTPFYVGEDND